MLYVCHTVFAIYFAYRYFCDFGLGGEICDGLISQFLRCFLYNMNHTFYKQLQCLSCMFCNIYFLLQEYRAANSHAFHHILTLIYMLISHAQFFFFACQRFVMYEGYPYYVPAKIKAKMLRLKKKVSDLCDFIGWQWTALVFLTPNPHPMLAAQYKGR